MERLERVVEAGGVLLKAERFDGPNPLQTSGLLLTFDVGRLLVEVDPQGAGVRTTLIESKDAVPPGLLDAAEEEPWWRLIGAPLSRLTAIETGARLQFRADSDNPRIVALERSNGEVRVTLDAMSRN